MKQDTPITIRIPTDLKERLDRQRDKSGVPISEMVRRGIEAYLTGHDARKEGK